MSGCIQAQGLICRSQVSERIEVEHSKAEVGCGKYINMVLLVTKQGPLWAIRLEMLNLSGMKWTASQKKHSFTENPGPVGDGHAAALESEQPADFELLISDVLIRNIVDQTYL